MPRRSGGAARAASSARAQRATASAVALRASAPASDWRAQLGLRGSRAAAVGDSAQSDWPRFLAHCAPARRRKRAQEARAAGDDVALQPTAQLLMITSKKHFNFLRFGGTGGWGWVDLGGNRADIPPLKPSRSRLSGAAFRASAPCCLQLPRPSPPAARCTTPKGN